MGKKNSEVAKEVLESLLKKISRRTYEEYAIQSLNNIIQKSKSQYEFLSYISLKESQYVENPVTIAIDKDIDSVDQNYFYKGLNEVIQKTIIYIGHTADYFFIREFKDSIDAKNESILEDKGLNLDLMQSNYLLERKELFKIENNVLIEDILGVLLRLIGKHNSKKKTILLLNSMLSTLEKKYKFLKYVKITEIKEREDSCEIEIYPDINEVWSLKIGEFIQDLLEKTKRSIHWEENISFTEAFKKGMGKSQLTILERIGINFKRINDITRSKNDKRSILSKTLEAIINFITIKTNASFAMATLDTLIENLKNDNDVFQLIHIEKSLYSQGFEAIIIDEEINDIKPYEIGKALRKIIGSIGETLDQNDKLKFIENIRKYLGEDYLSDIEQIGINLHILELKLKI